MSLNSDKKSRINIKFVKKNIQVATNEIKIYFTEYLSFRRNISEDFLSNVNVLVNNVTSFVICKRTPLFEHRPTISSGHN